MLYQLVYSKENRTFSIIKCYIIKGYEKGIIKYIRGKFVKVFIKVKRKKIIVLLKVHKGGIFEVLRRDV